MHGLKTNLFVKREKEFFTPKLDYPIAGSLAL